MEVREGEHVVLADVPLSTMIGYSSVLRSMTSGSGTFSMHFDRYEPLTDQQIKELRGGKAA